MKNIVWQIKNPKILLLIYMISYKNGLKPGDRPTAVEFYEAWIRHPEWIEPLGSTNLDVDQITGELREKGLKVFNPKELERRRRLKEDN